MILITGASGFLGGRLAQVLAEKGEAVRIINRQPGLPAHLAALPIEVTRASLDDLPALVSAMKDVEVVFHCGACSSDWAPWSVFHAANVSGVANILRAAASASSLSRFVHISTADVYGYPVVPCDEDGPLVDSGLPYNRSKILGEREVWRASGEGLPVTVLRPTTIYGPRSKDFAVEIDKLLRQGIMMHVDQGRSTGGFIYVDDVVDAMLGASTSGTTVGRAYNIAPEIDSTWHEFVEAMSVALGHKPPWLNFSRRTANAVGLVSEVIYRTARIGLRPPLTRHAVNVLSRNQSFPIGRAKHDFGFAPKVGLSVGVQRTVEWLKGRAIQLKN